MIVVTGAAGFIGSNVVAGLNARGRRDIVACDWLREDDRWKNLRKSFFREFVFPPQLLGSLERYRSVDAVIHMGANSSTTEVRGDEIIQTNLQASIALLEWCAAKEVPLIYASSAATYGDGSAGFDDTSDFEELRKLRPLNLYGWTKHQFDLVVAERRLSGLPLPPKCIGLKFFNVFGQNEYHKAQMMSVLAKNYELASSGSAVKLFKSHREGIADGEQSRDFIYVDDVVDIVLWSLDSGPSYGIFNVGTGQPVSFRRLVEALFQAVNRPPSIEYVPMPEDLRSRYQYFTQASLTALRKAGYGRNFQSIEDSVAAYVRYLGSDDKYR